MRGSYHIQHNANPELVRAILEIICHRRESKRENIINSLNSLFPQYSKSAIKESMLIKNKIIDDSKIKYLLKMDEVMFNNYLHYKLYSSKLPIGWSYRCVIDILYEEYVGKKIDYNDIEQKVKDKAFDEGLGSISFSSNSVRGAINFIRSLFPSPIDDNIIFNLRNYCQPHLLLWGIDYLYKKQWGNEYGSLMLLDDKKIEELCKFCLIEEDILDNHLKELDFMYDFVEISIKAFGRYIRLKREWNFNDIL